MLYSEKINKIFHHKKITKKSEEDIRNEIKRGQQKLFKQLEELKKHQREIEKTICSLNRRLQEIERR